MLCGALSLALFSGCETEQAACEREKRITERMDELQMELDGRMMGMNAEMASMRANPPVIVQQVPAPMPAPEVVPSAFAQAPEQSMQVDTISIEDDFYSMNKRQQLEQLAARSRDNYAPAPARASSSANTNRIRVPVPARTVQAALKEAGYYNGALDGKVGKGTIAAITNFQRDQNIKADGIVGRQTWQLLYPYVPAGMSTTRLK
jgi:uncharacterized protein with FMN-binding domain